MSDRYKGGILSPTAPTVIPQSAGGVYTLSQQLQYQGQGVWPPAVNYPITKSLRFRSSASAYLNRTPASASGENQWTFSTWVKRGSINGSSQQIIGGNTTTSGGTRNVLQVEFGGDNTLQVYAFTNASGYYFQRVSNAVYRDPSAWYHLVVQFDPDNGTSANRIIAYINGQQVSWGTSSDSGAAGSISSSAYRSINNTYRNDINGGYQGGGAPIYFGDGYLAETIMVSGSLVSVSSFGETSTSTGVWIPKKYTGTYGTNGFYLKFTDTTSTSTLGTDFSGNSNTWTVNNISLTSGSTYDSMTDVPTLTSATTANYCVLNSLNQNSAITLSAGNLSFTASNNRFTTSTFAVTSGKWYWEFYPVAGGASGVGVGAILATTYVFGTAGFANGAGYTGVGYTSNGSKYISGTSSAYGATYGSGNVIGVALDLDSGTKTITFYKDNTSQGSINLPTSSEAWIVATDYSEAGTHSINFGQRPFSYTPPTGFVALNTFNLPTPTIGATASTTANKYMDATTYTGNATARTITNSGSIQPDFVWIKNRTSGSFWHQLYDVNRGALKGLFSNDTSSESTYTDTLTAFTSTGFNLGTDATFNGGVNKSGDAYVAWQWKANGAAVTNTAGSISSQVSANTSAGFSIVTYTGNGTGGATVGHGLGVAPSMIIVKNRTTAGTSWAVYTATTGATNYLRLNSTIASTAGSSFWNNTTPTSSVFSIGTDSDVNANTNNIVAYCFAPVAGYSAFGSYTGNGSSDGPFVFTGFRPRFVMTKKSSSTGGWGMVDTSINPYNQATTYLQANTSNATVGGTSANGLDFVSNGFKIRSTDASFNETNGDTYIYMAFAENPFKIANAR